jgi:hypothetical protein
LPRFSVIVPAYRVQAYLPVRLPRAVGVEFPRTARAHGRRRIPGLAVPVRSRPRHTLVHLGLHGGFRALRQASGLRRRGAKAMVRLLRGARAAALRLHHHVRLRLPLRAVFAVQGGRGHGCAPGAPETAFRTHAPHSRAARAARPENHRTIPGAARRVGGGEWAPPPVVPLIERHPVPSSPTAGSARAGGPPPATLARSPFAAVPHPAGSPAATDRL